jgi:hypothetical protein
MVVVHRTPDHDRIRKNTHKGEGRLMELLGPLSKGDNKFQDEVPKGVRRSRSRILIRGNLRDPE